MIVAPLYSLAWSRTRVPPAVAAEFKTSAPLPASANCTVTVVPGATLIFVCCAQSNRRVRCVREQVIRSPEGHRIHARRTADLDLIVVVEVESSTASLPSSHAWESAHAARTPIAQVLELQAVPKVGSR